VSGSSNDGRAAVSTQVKACGNTAAVGGYANSGCKGGSNSTTVVGSGGSGSGNGTSGVASVPSGNTVNAPVSAPVNVCGLSLALLGFANSGCEGGASTTTVVGNGGGNGNSGGVSLLSRNTVNAPISAPVNV
jgi:ChpA-C